MAERIQVLLEPGEKARLSRIAREAGLSLSAWMRRAALERAMSGKKVGRIDKLKTLRTFFETSDRAEPGNEPPWYTHKAVIERSRRQGQSDT